MKTRFVMTLFMVSVLTAACQSAAPAPITPTIMATLTATNTLTPTSIPLTSNPSPTSAPLSPVIIATAIAPATGPQLVHMDFKQSGADLGNTSGDGWSAANGLLRVQSNPSSSDLPTILFGSEVWTNYLFEFRYNVTTCKPSSYFGCKIVTTFRNEGGQSYVLLIDTKRDEVSLVFGGRNGWVNFNKGITDTSLNIPLGTWHDVLIAADQDRISVSVDGIWTSAVSDNRLKTGAVGVAVGAGTTAQFDVFNAWSIPSGAP